MEGTPTRVMSGRKKRVRVLLVRMSRLTLDGDAVSISDAVRMGVGTPTKRVLLISIHLGYPIGFFLMLMSSRLSFLGLFTTTKGGES